MKAKTRKKRFNKLIGVVKRIPQSKLDLSVFEYQDGCKTVRCVLGWAVFDPWFQKQGWRPIVRDNRLVSIGWRHRINRYGDTLTYQILDANAFFDLSNSAVQDLFTPRDLPSSLIKRKPIIKNLKRARDGKSTRQYTASDLRSVWRGLPRGIGC